MYMSLKGNSAYLCPVPITACYCKCDAFPFEMQVYE